MRVSGSESKRAAWSFLRRAYKQGVKMIAGTDGGCPQVGFDLMPLAIRLLNEYLGLSPMEALQGRPSIRPRPWACPMWERLRRAARPTS